MKDNRVKIEKWTDDKSTEYDYKVLIYGNYTYRKNLEADSLVEVLRHVIPFMSKQQKIHFTIPIPEYVESLTTNLYQYYATTLQCDGVYEDY